MTTQGYALGPSAGEHQKETHTHIHGYISMPNNGLLEPICLSRTCFGAQGCPGIPTSHQHDTSDNWLRWYPASPGGASTRRKFEVPQACHRSSFANLRHDKLFIELYVANGALNVVTK